MVIILLQLICFTLGSIVGLQPEKVYGPLTTTIIKDYPSAKDITMFVFRKGSVPTSNSRAMRPHRSVISKKFGILTEKNLRDSVQSKLKGLSIEGGVSSNHRLLDVKGQPSRLVADYLLNGVKYVLSMESSGYVRLSTSTLLSKTKLLSDLPEGVQKFLKERSKPNQANVLNLLQLDAKGKQILEKRNELSFVSCFILQSASGAKQYRVYVDYFGLTTLPLIFDENGKLLWAANFNRIESLRKLDDVTGGPSKVVGNELAHFKTLFNKAAEFTHFKLDDSLLDSDASKNTYGGISGYEFNLVNKTESWHLAYSNDKTLIEGYYSGWAQ